MRKHLAALLCAFFASSAFAAPDLEFTCTDAAGCEGPLPTETVISAFLVGGQPVTDFQFSWSGISFPASSEFDSTWLLGGAWSLVASPATDLVILNMEYGGSIVSRSSLYLGEAAVNDSGTWVGRAAFVPEPGPLALLGFGLLGVGLARRRKQ